VHILIRNGAQKNSVKKTGRQENKEETQAGIFSKALKISVHQI